MNGRQNAYRQTESIGRILAQHGRDCPLCFRTCYSAYVQGRRVVCPRCRGFGCVLDVEVSLSFISNIGEKAEQLTDYLVTKFDCPV
jgi:hypothetical protein